MAILLLIIGVAVYLGIKYGGDDVNTPVPPGESNIDTAMKEREDYVFKQKCDALRNRIKAEISKLEADKTTELANSNACYISELKSLANYTMSTEKDYDYVSWRFNNGNLRSSIEQQERSKQERAEEYVSSGEFDKECKSRNIYAAIIPFIVVFFLVFCMCEEPIIGLPLGLLAGLIASLIGMIMGYSANIRRGEEMGVPDSNPRMKKERFNKTGATIATIGVLGSTVHKAGKAAKDLGNVDSWKQTK